MYIILNYKYKKILKNKNEYTLIVHYINVKIAYITPPVCRAIEPLTFACTLKTFDIPLATFFVNTVIKPFTLFMWSWDSFLILLGGWLWFFCELERLRLQVLLVFVSVIVCVWLLVENSMFGSGVFSKTKAAGGGCTVVLCSGCQITTTDGPQTHTHNTDNDAKAQKLIRFCNPTLFVQILQYYKQSPTQ